MTPVNTDERPFVLIWEVTQACELACEHCRADATPDRHPDELTTAEGKALLEDVRRFGDGQLVVLSGGDPLAREDTVEFVEYGTDIGLRMTVTPSGTRSLSTEAVRALADAGVKQLAVSIDGATPESHDSFRGETGSFEETVRAARDAREAGVPLQVNTTVCSQTVDDLPAIRDLVRELGAVLWSVFFLVPVGRGRVLDPISPERAEDVMEFLDDVSREEEFGVKTTEAPHFRRVRAQQAQARGGSGPQRRGGITAGDGFAFVSHTGDVYPSGFLPESAGNVREESVVDVYRNSDLFESLREKDELQGKCGACSFRHVCGGSRSRAYAVTGDPLGSDPLCPHVPENYDGPLPSRLGAADD
ncbi:TIGR04053 family radical SAM/SPASM domain-containing protein [Halobacterium sp. R2-5]|uniref:TIGR04053 family radical SAM/SPASM domain-containing protein n=1 Tax=Halobacterium sp. R2-5 TaxID=2715751 RepID=UPI00141EBA43|nr:TIGR04053 family radical SAM/SPASM domain-containing protein [Halobacterium sp. R2-5]NIC00490.1 TIGR04053 family radical SAM/SPASM domain-containing protein [Halobacterium sp. R2-5]